MGKDTKIEWAHHTFNPWIGCTRVSQACDHCYAAASTPARVMAIKWGPGQPRRRTARATWDAPLAWNRRCERLGIRERVFCASLADVFDNEVSEEWRNDLWELIASTPHLDWLMLTKRVGNVAGMLPITDSAKPGYRPWNERWPWPNVWLGATVVTQAEADRDIPKLLNTPAAKRFLSIEPMLGPIDLTRICLVPKVEGSHRAGIHIDALAGRYVESGLPYVGEWDVAEPYPVDAPPLSLDWVIVGGESGIGARPMCLSWAQSLRDQCAEAGVPFLFKQWGEWAPAGQSVTAGHTIYEFGYDEDERLRYHRVGKEAAGRLLDGVQHDGVPA